MAQKQLDVLTIKENVLLPVSFGKDVRVKDGCIEIGGTYGKRVIRRYKLSFTNDEWIKLNERVYQALSLVNKRG